MKIKFLLRCPPINNLLIMREFPLDMIPWEKFISEVEPLALCLEEESPGGY